MLRTAVLFFVLALISMAIGASHMSSVAVEVSRILVLVFLFAAVITGLIGIFRGRGGPKKHIG